MQIDTYMYLIAVRLSNTNLSDIVSNGDAVYLQRSWWFAIYFSKRMIMRCDASILRN